MRDRAMDKIIAPRTFRDKLGEILYKLAFHDNPMNWVPRPDTPAFKLSDGKVIPAQKARNLLESSKEEWRKQADRFVDLALELGLRWNLSIEEEQFLAQRKSAWERVIELGRFLSLKEFLWSMHYNKLLKRVEEAELKVKELSK